MPLNHHLSCLLIACTVAALGQPRSASADPAPATAPAAQATIAKAADQAFLARDYATAYTLYLRLANAGHPEAMCVVGTLYQNGQGVPKDPSEALRWYLRAAGGQHHREV